MPNLGKLLKLEIERISRKEAKKENEIVRRQIVFLKKTVSELKSKIAVLERDNKRLKNMGKNNQSEKPDNRRIFRITAKGMRSLRKRLKLTQAEFAKLVKTSSQSVYNWESKEGALTLRSATKKAIIEIRDMSTRNAKEKLKTIK